jgi:hypothetical protein
MSKETGCPAFPCEVGPASDMHTIQTGDRQWQQPGMTLRDYFAVRAMQAYWSDDSLPSSVTKENAAEWSYAMADAMMEARK